MKRFVALLLALCLLLPAVAALAQRTLVKGMEGDDVLAAQIRLALYGYYTGDQDGYFSQEMYVATRQFQRRNDLVVDGKIGPKTLDVLNSDDAIGKDDPDPGTTLKIGDSGEPVRDLQRALRKFYYYGGKIDGIFGSEVLRAVKAFQASTGLTADGKAGPRTLDALYNETAKIFQDGAIPVRSLSMGSRGYDVYILQLKLADLNYDMGYATPGVFDTDTAAAVKAFQKKVEMKVDGKVGSEARRYLWPKTVDKDEEEKKKYEGTPDDPYTERTLKLGKRGDDVANMQMRLKAGGYFYGEADGNFGKDTEAAVIRFQKANNLKPDGIVGEQTWALIKLISLDGAEPGIVDENPGDGAYTKKLKRGSRGTQVKKLQQQLITLGYLEEGDDDGKFGPKTAMAVMNFQKDHGLTVDGIAGYQTFAALNEILGT